MPDVMIVEDEKIIRQGIANLVKRYGNGLNVRWECTNAFEAWDVFQTDTPDLVITDIIMKGMTGLELIKRIRDRGSNVPVVVLSGFSEFSYAKTALRYGVTDYLLKPVDIKEFSETLDRIKRELEQSNPPPEQNADVENAAVRRAVKWIDQHLGEDLSLPIVAQQVGLSGSYLSVLFYQHMNIHYSDYILRQRIQKAEELLKNTGFCIYEIAQLCGYHSAKHFINIFKRYSGTTPSQYRNGHQKND